MRRLLMALVVSLAALAPAATAQAVELGVVTDLTWGAPDADRARTLTALDDLHARWVRIEINWAEVEPQRGAYHQWSLDQIDRTVADVRGRGLHAVVLIQKAPKWATGSDDQGTPPRDPADYARFASFIASRYAGRGIDGYEVWNEPNIGRFWGGAPDPAAYVALLRAAAPAIRAADPGAKVVFGGLSTSDWAFVDAAYAAGAHGLFDVMAVHPYTCAHAPTDVWRDAGGRIDRSAFTAYREVRASMLANGDDLPIWFTEFGWSTAAGDACGVTPQQQAQFVTEAAGIAAQDPYVQGAMYYNMRNNWWSGDGPGIEDQYGLVTTGFDRKPAFAALAAAALVTPPAPAAARTAHSAAAGPRAQAASKLKRRARPPRKPKAKAKRRSARRARAVQTTWRIVSRLR